MNRRRETTEDIETLLAELDEASSPRETEPTRPPPRERRAVDPSTYQGRAKFEGLFAADTAPQLVARAGLDEKVEYFRDKVKFAEAQTARFREAWATREAELDAVEALLLDEKQRADGATSALAQLQAFLQKKKQELTAYNQMVTEMIAEKDATITRLGENLSELRSKTERHKGEHSETKESLERDIALRDEALHKVKAALKEANAKLQGYESRTDKQLGAFNRAEAGPLMDHLKKALSVISKQLRELEAASPGLQRDAEAREVLERLHKASTIARNAMERLRSM